VRKADNLTTILCRWHESGNRNFLETSGQIQACNGTDLPLPLQFSILPPPPPPPPPHKKKKKKFYFL